MAGNGLFVSGAQAANDGSLALNEISIPEKKLPADMPRFAYQSGYKFDYPDAVRGVYVTGTAAGGAKMDSLIKLMDDTELNSMVIDVKDDSGNFTFHPDKKSPYYEISKGYIKDPKAMMKKLETHKIYPIGRIVVFKDNVLADKKPEWSYKKDGKVWQNGTGAKFVNPFVKEVWDYNVNAAIEAAKMGFKEIQFDYVRFPEGFENKDKELSFSEGDYRQDSRDNTQKRVQAVTDFTEYAKKKLKPYGVKVSVDIFGYSATLPEAPGIGQNFSRISENVDVISSMIYPSHWGPYFGIEKPDTEPYRLVKEYAKVENKKLDGLKTRPVSRPWLQDFTASYLGKGNYLRYGKPEVEAQIKALNEEGIDEFLLWNASNRYTKGIDYTPLK
ncbi:putative glycoside hydrolase [Bacillus sp. FJAT-42376]|uniref:putative glycoside hydrolase n=1 Tax=Bacillus sp. FJAT-42376 TaxID=2014076 RepID=UPI001F14C5B3|nr:putative glycoside hydrolase [Bacillus sp. FJAT-42376]